MVVWPFFGIAFLWDWNENWPFPVLWLLLSFPNLLAYWVQRFHIASSFRIWNSSTGIPSPPLALFVVMLSKASWLHIPGCLALGEWSHHSDYLGRENLFCTVLLCILPFQSSICVNPDVLPMIQPNNSAAQQAECRYENPAVFYKVRRPSSLQKHRTVPFFSLIFLRSMDFSIKIYYTH